ncbi:hypothetical protein [Metabacillus iocasae]|uniref:Uncharacterized protein n=1 Tax=Priestia iocasae TaxID=2291674 RepID=A0ABS2QX89_9BACI|nr:hypothetical protein [Metabacillus iocasae]MBM7703366.1 hypothetical protein [Metabacillus iocasae]
MKSIQDALYNWLSIKIVADARPDDLSAQETFAFFQQMLEQDFSVKEVSVTKDEMSYTVSYKIDHQEETKRFPVELIECMYEQIKQEPEKFRNYPSA